MIVNLKYKDESEDVDLSRLKRRLAWEVKGIKLWEFVFNVLGVQRENSDVSKLSKVLVLNKSGNLAVRLRLGRLKIAQCRFTSVKSSKSD